MTINLNDRVTFASRHNGNDPEATREMLQAIGVNEMEELIHQAIPDSIRMQDKMKLPEALNEFEYIQHIRKMANENEVYNSFIGQGYYNTVVPAVIQRNILDIFKFI
jgi:glycine dehydrogenase